MARQTVMRPHVPRMSGVDFVELLAQTPGPRPPVLMRSTEGLMAKHPLGIALTPTENEAIVAWLEALDGELPAALTDPPELP